MRYAIQRDVYLLIYYILFFITHSHNVPFISYFICTSVTFIILCIAQRTCLGAWMVYNLTKQQNTLVMHTNPPTNTHTHKSIKFQTVSTSTSLGIFGILICCTFFIHLLVWMSVGVVYCTILLLLRNYGKVIRYRLRLNYHVPQYCIIIDYFSNSLHIW